MYNSDNFLFLNIVVNFVNNYKHLFFYNHLKKVFIIIIQLIYNIEFKGSCQIDKEFLGNNEEGMFTSTVIKAKVRQNTKTKLNF